MDYTFELSDVSDEQLEAVVGGGEGNKWSYKVKLSYEADYEGEYGDEGGCGGCGGRGGRGGSGEYGEHGYYGCHPWHYRHYRHYCGC